MSESSKKSDINTFIRFTQKWNDISGTALSTDEAQGLFTNSTYSKGNFFLMEGDVCKSLAFVVRGLFKYFYIDQKGNEWINMFALENEFLGSYASFMTQTPSLYYIQALEDSEIIPLNYTLYQSRLRVSPRWNAITMDYTLRMFCHKEKRESEFLKLDATQRYLNFNKEHTILRDRLDLKDVASYLGISQVSLSRIRRTLKESG